MGDPSKKLPSRFKVVMLGNSGVGKTAMVSRIVDDIFNDQHVPTVGAQYASIKVSIGKDECVLEIWDTAGQEVFRSLVGFYTRDTHGAFIIFDVTDRKSFDDLGKWVEFIKEASPGVEILIFGNKIDRTDVERQVTNDEIEQFSTHYGLTIFEGSAKTKEGISELFDQMTENLIVAKSTETKPKEALEITPSNTSEEKKKCC